MFTYSKVLIKEQLDLGLLFFFNQLALFDTKGQSRGVGVQSKSPFDLQFRFQKF